MGMEDVFNGAKSALTFYDAYLKTVGEEIGMDKAVSLHTKMFETMGEMQGSIYFDYIRKVMTEEELVMSLKIIINFIVVGVIVITTV